MSSVQIDLWNVGQGDASTIQLPTKELVVIDTGPPINSLTIWLTSSGQAVKIKHLILTHNDSDHIGGVENILACNNVAIDNVWLLQDTHPPKMIRRLFNLLSKKAKNFCRLEAEKDAVKQIEQFGDYSLQLRHPDFSSNISSTTSNRTSAIIVLTHKDKDCISWGSDNLLATISNCVNSGVDMQIGPHHGAPQDFRQSSDCVTTLAPSHCFISVGSNNKYKHPNAEYIKRLCVCRCIPMCSQLTPQCSRELFKKGKDIYNSAGLYGLIPPSGLQCCGHLRFFLTDGFFELHDFSKQYIDTIAKLQYKTACHSVSGN